MKTITEILREYGAERPEGTDKQREHQYGPGYDQLFPESVRDNVRYVLEIGVAYGRSLLAWRDAFPNATIVGLDADPCVPAPRGERIEIHQGSQIDRGILASLARGQREFDLIIDDGSHILEHQLFTMFILWPHVKVGGVYLIEEFDVQNGVGPAWHTNACRSLFATGLMVDTMSHTGGLEPLFVARKDHA